MMLLSMRADAMPLDYSTLLRYTRLIGARKIDARRCYARMFCYALRAL